MRSIVFVLITSASLFAQADTQTLQVTGMHCGACAKSIEDTVCKMDGLKSCSARLVNAKKKQGEIVIERADGKPVDTKEITKILETAGDYTLVTEKKKK